MKNMLPKLKMLTFGCLLSMSSISCSTQTGELNRPETKIGDNQRAQLLVLGTSHLSNIGDDLRPEMLNSLLARLEKFEPNIVAIEVAPEWTSAAMLERSDVHKDTLESYVRSNVTYGKLAQKILEISWLDAITDYEDHKSPCIQNPGQVKCVLQALAAYDYSSSVLRWRYLSPYNKRQFSERYPKIDAKFKDTISRKNEIHILAGSLALQLNHHRLYSVDDHMEKGFMDRTLARYKISFEKIQGFWNRSSNPVYARQKILQKKSIANGDLLPYYQSLNSLESAEADYATQFAPMDRGEVGKAGLIFKAYWDTRMLRSASHIANLFAENPQAKILFIVGASHKNFIDGYFNKISWVDVVNVKPILE